MAQLFNSGKDAREAARRNAKLSEIANLRQQNSIQANDTRTGASRRAPRGRRLLVTDASQKSDLS